MMTKYILNAGLIAVLLVAPAAAHDIKSSGATFPQGIAFPGDILFPSDTVPSDFLALRADVITYTRQLNELADVVLFDVKQDGRLGMIVFDRSSELFDNLVGFYEITQDLAKVYSENNPEQAEKLRESVQAVQYLTKQEIDPKNNPSVINFMQNLKSITDDILKLISR